MQSLAGYLSLPEAAEVCSVSTATLRRWMHAGTFPHGIVLPGGDWRIEPREIERWLAWRIDCGHAKRLGAETPATPEWRLPTRTSQPVEAKQPC